MSANGRHQSGSAGSGDEEFDFRYSLRDLIGQFRTGIPRGQLARLADQTPVNTAVTLSLIAIILVTVETMTSAPGLYLWGAVQAALILLVHFRWRKLSADPPLTSATSLLLTRSGLRHAVLWAALSGGLWGGLTAFLPSLPPHIQIGLILVMGGMAAGASATLAAVPQAAIIFILGCGLPLTIYQLTLGDQAGQFLALVFAIFTAAMLGTSRVTYIALMHQLRAEKRARQLDGAGLQRRIAEKINQAESVDEALQFCLDEVCRYTGWPVGHVYLLAGDGSGLLVPSGIWHLDDEKRFSGLKQITAESKFRSGQGIPGWVMEHARPIWKSIGSSGDDSSGDDIPISIDEMIASGNFPRTEISVKSGIKALFGFPVLVGSNVVAVLEFLSDSAVRPDEHLMESLETVATMLGRTLERHRAELDLRESEEKFRTLIESSAQGMAVHRDGKFLYVTQEGARNFGYSVDEILALDSVFDLVHPDYHERMMARAAARIAGEPVPDAYEFDGVHRDGHTITLYARSSTIEWQGETALMMTTVDVSERKQAEEQYRMLLDSTAEAIYGIDLQGNCTFINPACISMLGYRDQSELLGKNMHLVMHHTRSDGSDYPTKECKIYQAFRDGKGTHVDDEVLWRADGSSFPAEYWSHPIFKNGEVVGSVVTFLDITERMAAEKALLESRATLEDAQSMARIGNYEWNITTGELYWSDRLYRIYGVDPATFVPTEEKIMQFNHPDDYQKVVDHTERAIAEEGVVELSCRLVWPNGEIRFVQSHGEVTRDLKSGNQIMRGTVQDQTDRWLADQQLRREQARLSGILDLAVEAVVSVGEDQRIQIFNRGAEVIFGYAAKEVIGKPIEVLLPKKSRTDHRKHLETFDHSARPRRMGAARPEITGLRKDGSEFPAEASISRIEVDGEKLFTATLRDLTEQKEAEAALRKSELGLANAQRIAHIGSWEWDIPTDTVSWSDENFRIYDLPPQETTPTYKMFLEHIHPEDRAPVDAAVRAALDDDEPYLIEHRIVLPNDKVRVLRERAEVYRDDQGNPIRMAGTVQDITEQKRAEDVARREHAQAKEYLNIAGSLIMALDAEGRITLMNQSARLALECGSEDVIGKNWVETFAPEEERADRHQRYQDRISKTGDQPGFNTVTVVTRTGKRLLTRWHIKSIFDGAGTVIGVLCSGEDITEQRRAEAQLRQSQKMEAVGQLTSGIAHDFNNMLAVVMGNLEMAVEAGESGKSIGKYLTVALQGAQRGADLNKQLLTFSRQRIQEEKITDVNEIILGMSGLLERTLGEHVEIVTSVAEGNHFGKLDPAQLESAILNLSINARDAMPGGGRLTIETMIIGSDRSAGGNGVEANSGMIRISVRDDGAGMTAEVKEHALEPFYTTKEIGAGSGLGLSMVYAFVLQSGGQLEIESVPGRGTTIHLILPLVDVTDQDIDVSRGDGEMPTAVSGEAILVVEDQPEVRDIIVTYLGDLGYEVLEAEDGRATIKILDKFKSIDLILSDMMLPGDMNGEEVVSRARAILPDLKSLYMSGNPVRSGEDRKSGKSRAPILRKPFRKAELARAVRDRLDQN